MHPIPVRKSGLTGFFWKKENWIRQKVKLQKENANEAAGKEREMPEAEKKYYRNLAREVLGARTGYYARKMGADLWAYFHPGAEDQVGSCSSAGNLNYNWKLVLMPPGSSGLCCGA